MASEGNKAVLSDQPPSSEQSAISGAKRKRGRPRKHQHAGYEPPQRAQPIQSVPPLRSMLDNSNMQHDGVQVNHTSAGSIDPKMRTILPQQAQVDRSSRPRDSAYLVKNSSVHVQGNSGQDFIMGKQFTGKMSKKYPGFSLITVKVKENQVLKGWIPDENDLRPIAPKDDLAPELAMLPPSQVRKRASAIHSQAATPLPVHFKDVTHAKPLQMRRPVEKYISKPTIPPAPRPYIGCGAVAAAPISVTPRNAESRPLPKQEPKPVIPEQSTTVVPIKFAPPALISCKQVDNQDVPVEAKPVTQIQEVSESVNRSKELSEPEKLDTSLVGVVVKQSTEESNLLNVTVTDVAKESSSQIQNADPAVMDDIEIVSGPTGQSNSANNKEQYSKELSDNTEQSEQPKTEIEILEGVGSPKSYSTSPINVCNSTLDDFQGTTPATESSSATHKPLDHTQSLHGEHEMKVDSK